MTRISEEVITDIRNKADIVDIVGRYVSLKKQGRNFVGICPFHDDHNPSMSVSPDKQIYKCFVCGAGGNVFTFVQNYEKLSFPEAVQKVAGVIGIQIELNFTAHEEQYDESTLHYFSIMDESIRFLNYQLLSSSGSEALLYLQERDINTEAIKYFEIGYDKDDQLSTFLLKKDYPKKDLLALGLIREYGGKYYDFFANRLTFPIHDSLGKPVAFSARTMANDTVAKYINTGETPLYQKGNILYNYHRAKEAARKEAEVYLVEGVIDVIALYSCQIENVVASLGTAFTREQLRLLRMLSKQVVISYDSDNAGRMASYKVGKMLSEARIPFELIKDLQQLDPDDYRRKYGSEALKKALGSRLTWIEFLIGYLAERFDLTNYSDRKNYAAALMEEISKIDDEFDRMGYLNRLAEITTFDIEQLKLLKINVAVNNSKAANSKHRAPHQQINRVERAEYTIIAQMLASKRASQQFQRDLGFLFRQNLNKVVLLIMDYYRNHEEMILADLLSVMDDEERKLVISISDNEILSSEYNVDILNEAMNIVRIAIVDEKIAEIKMQKSLDVNTNNKLAEELKELINEKSRLMRKKEE